MEQAAIAHWANIAEIIGAFSIVGGILFGLFQLRYYRVQQRDVVAINLAQTFYNDNFAQAIALLQTLPDGIGLQELRAKGGHYVEAAVAVTTSFETMGLLVFKRIAPLDLVMDLAGGVITTMERKLSVWQEELRLELDQPSWGEWFSWLAYQARLVKTINPPAHIYHRQWKPR